MDILIPIAKSNKTNKTVFIDDVCSGLSCDCRCIACNVPLVARKGKVNIHHFAHAAKEVNRKRYCRFSFDRSVFWMIRQVLSETEQINQINLPSYTIRLQDKLVPNIYQKRVTNRHRVNFDSVEFPESLDRKHKEDVAILSVSGYPLAITFCLKNKPVHSPYHWQTSHAYFKNGKPIAHIEVNLSGLQKNFSQQKRDYRDILKEMVFNSYSRKTWQYHPNEQTFRLEFEHQVNKVKAEKRSAQVLCDQAAKQEKARRKKIQQQEFHWVKLANKKSRAKENITPVESYIQGNDGLLKIKIEEPLNMEPTNNNNLSPLQLNDQELDLKSEKKLSLKATHQPEPIAHVEQKRLKDKINDTTKERLAQLLDQAKEFKKEGNKSGNRCKRCYFMNLVEQKKCQYCKSESMIEVELNNNYFDNIDHKYDCGCFAIFSVKALEKID